MNRMHPEDLRTIVAAIQCLDPHSRQAVTSEQAVLWADDLLAELAKTAKPEAEPEEPPPTTSDWCMHIRRACPELRGARESQDRAWTRAETAEARAKELEQMFGDLLARIHGDGGHYIIEHGWHKATKDGDEKIVCWQSRVKELEVALQTARADGAREERERIIDVLDKTDYGMVVGWRRFKRDELVRVLESKP